MEAAPLTVRRCRKEDWETVIAIANRAFQPARRHSRQALGDKLADLVWPGGDHRSKGEEVRRHLEAHPDQCVVCESEGRIVGFATFKFEGAFGIISNNGADPEHHIPGTGLAMYREILRIFRAAGCQAARVVTGLADIYLPARRSYEKVGFRRRIENVTYYLDLDELR